MYFRHGFRFYLIFIAVSRFSKKTRFADITSLITARGFRLKVSANDQWTSCKWTMSIDDKLISNSPHLHVRSISLYTFDLHLSISGHLIASEYGDNCGCFYYSFEIYKVWRGQQVCGAIQFAIFGSTKQTRVSGNMHKNTTSISRIWDMITTKSKC